MGEIADMILEGLLDEETGEYIGDDDGNGYGYPTSARKQQELQSKGKSKKPKFNPTKDNLQELSKSLTVTHLEQLIEMVLKRTSHDWCTRHTFNVTADGCDSSIVTTGPEFIKAHGGEYKNLRGHIINE